MSNKRKTPARQRALTARSSLSVMTGTVLSLREIAVEPVAITAAPASIATPPSAPIEVKKAPIAAPPPRVALSSEERRRMIAGLAYGRAERAGFNTDPIQDWLMAERELEAILERRAS
jgi:hypothetical protein